MTKGYLIKMVVSLAMMLTAVSAQENVDAIEKARQAKEAADKAAAEAAAATSAAIEAAAAKAAKEAREEAKRKKEEEEARKIAEAKAAEEAELDAAAAAAAEEAKRKMAAELGLEVDDPEVEEAVAESATSVEDVVEEAEDVVAKEASGFNIGVSGSVGFIQGGFFSNVPTGGSLVITTPYGFDVSGLRFGLSATVGAYPAEHKSGETFTPLALGLGGNLTLAKMVFVEGHLGLVGDSMGARGFAGVSLERLMKNVKLPFNVLVGAEGFMSTLMKEGIGKTESDGTGGSASYWGGLAFRIDF